jgi:hypothetical protein
MNYERFLVINLPRTDGFYNNDICELENHFVCIVDSFYCLVLEEVSAIITLHVIAVVYSIKHSCRLPFFKFF